MARSLRSSPSRFSGSGEQVARFSGRGATPRIRSALTAITNSLAIATAADSSASSAWRAAKGASEACDSITSAHGDGLSRHRAGPQTDVHRGGVRGVLEHHRARVLARSLGKGGREAHQAGVE